MTEHNFDVFLIVTFQFYRRPINYVSISLLFYLLYYLAILATTLINARLQDTWFSWFSSLSSEHLCVFGLHGANDINFFVASWLTNYCPSVL